MAYFVAWRLQRVTVEYTYISVPVLADLMDEQEDGTARINVEKMMERAVAGGQSLEQVWYQESQTVEVHPIQQPVGEGEVLRRMELPEGAEAAMPSSTAEPA